MGICEIMKKCPPLTRISRFIKLPSRTEPSVLSNIGCQRPNNLALPSNTLIISQEDDNSSSSQTSDIKRRIAQYWTIFKYSLIISLTSVFLLKAFTHKEKPPGQRGISDFVFSSVQFWLIEGWVQIKSLIKNPVFHAVFLLSVLVITFIKVRRLGTDKRAERARRIVLENDTSRLMAVPALMTQMEPVRIDEVFENGLNEGCPFIVEEPRNHAGHDSIELGTCRSNLPAIGCDPHNSGWV